MTKETVRRSCVRDVGDGSVVVDQLPLFRFLPEQVRIALNQPFMVERS